MRISPQMKPPTCAHTATPPEVSVGAPSEVMPETNWVMNQKTIRNAAAMRGTRINGPTKTRVRTWALGKSRRYAARMPAMAPEAPRC